MTVALDHTLVPATDKRASAEFLAGILGIPPGGSFGDFETLPLGGGITLFFTDADRIDEHHYAFLVSDVEFDAAVGRLKAAGTTIYAKSDRTVPGQVNERWGGRGLYFDDLDGHLIELLTRSPSPNASSANHPNHHPQ